MFILQYFSLKRLFRDPDKVWSVKPLLLPVNDFPLWAGHYFVYLLWATFLFQYIILLGQFTGAFFFSAALAATLFQYFTTGIFFLFSFALAVFSPYFTLTAIARH